MSPTVYSQKGGVTPPPLPDCFLLSILLNYFSSDSHMWVFSSLAGRLTLWRREAEAQLTGEASRNVFWLKKDTQCVCRCQIKTGAHSVECNSYSSVSFTFTQLQCTASPSCPELGKSPNSWPNKNIESIHHLAILLSLPSTPPEHNSYNCSYGANINISSYKKSSESHSQSAALQDWAQRRVWKETE